MSNDTQIQKTDQAQETDTVQDVDSAKKAAPIEDDKAMQEIKIPSQSNDMDDMFASISDKYDMLNHVLSFGMDFLWRYRMVRNVSIGPSKKFLDMAAGTLDVSRSLLKHFPQAHVVAGDICQPMLDYGKSKLKYNDINRITMQKMDVVSIPYPDNSFDAITIAFGYRNFNDHKKALEELHRVLIPGGSLYVMEYSPVTTPLFGSVYHWYLEKVMPRIADIICGNPDPYTYLSRSISDFFTPEEIEQQFKDTGFPFVKKQKFTFGIVNLYIATRQ